MQDLHCWVQHLNESSFVFVDLFLVHLNLELYLFGKQCLVSALLTVCLNASLESSVSEEVSQCWLDTKPIHKINNNKEHNANNCHLCLAVVSTHDYICNFLCTQIFYGLIPISDHRFQSTDISNFINWNCIQFPKYKPVTSWYFCRKIMRIQCCCLRFKQYLKNNLYPQ